MLNDDRNEESESSPLSLPLYNNSYLQNLLPFKIPAFSDSQTVSSIVQPITDVKDDLVPGLPNDRKIDSDRTGTDYPLITEETLSVPVNQYAINRISQENNLHTPVFEQWTDRWENTFDGSLTTSIPVTTLDQAYDSDRNYLSTAQVKEKILQLNTLATLAPDSCDNSCNELSHYYDNFSGMKTETSSSVEYDESEKLKQRDKEDKENYYDEIKGERRNRISFSRHPSLKKQPTISIDTIPEKFFQKMTQLGSKTQDKVTSFGKSDFQKTNVVKSKSKLHVASNNKYKQINKANNSDFQINISSIAENRKAQNFEKLKFYGYPTIIGLSKKHIFLSSNHDLLQANSVAKEPKNSGQHNVPRFSFLKFRMEPNNETIKILIKPVKLVRAQQNNFADEQLNTKSLMKESHKDNSLRIKNLLPKSFGKERNLLAETVHRSSKLQRRIVSNTVKKSGSGLQFSNIRKKPEQKKTIDSFLYYIPKSQTEDMHGKFSSKLVFEVQPDSWTNISDISREQSLRKKKLNEFSEVANMPIPEKGIKKYTLIPTENTLLNLSIEHQVLMKKNKLKKAIRTRRAKFFYSNIVKSS
ncbi:unnamed protein product [Brugia pahangi]|uniref:DH domain-containing protein n=1 Tax=Brugia pahangi TaxID=6280 RepID=A0A0N4T128_BRUPA|nr:unnamed protein product [Brugia pahangi]